MPHHPGGGAVVEQAIAGADVALEDVLFLVLYEGADCAVDNRLRLAGSSA